MTFGVGAVVHAEFLAVKFGVDVFGGILSGFLNAPTSSPVFHSPRPIIGGFSWSIDMRGGPQVRAAVGAMERELNRSFQGELRAIAEDVAAEARHLAPVRTGRLRRSIRTFARGNVVQGRATFGVAASARDRVTGYAYPKRLEYERGPRGRPFLEPAYRRKQPEVEAAMRHIERRLVAIWDS